MVSHQWTFVGETGYARIFVDYRKRMTKIISKKFIYYHDGIYPHHNPECSRRYKK